MADVNEDARALKQQLNKTKRKLVEAQLLAAGRDREIEDLKLELREQADQIQELRDQLSEAGGRGKRRRVDQGGGREGAEDRYDRDAAYGRHGDGVPNHFDEESDQDQQGGVQAALRAAAERSELDRMCQSLTYEPSSGLFYDSNSGLWFDPTTKLFFDARHQRYLRYVTESAQYVLHSVVYVDPETVAAAEERAHEESERQQEQQQRNRQHLPNVTAVRLVAHPDCKKLAPGTVFVVGISGARIGREKDNECVVPASEVSKTHCEIVCEQGAKRGNNTFTVRDLGSRNGTWLESSGNEAVQVKTKKGKRLRHLDTLRLGDGTRLLVHMHPPDAPDCGDCSKPQKQAHATMGDTSAKESKQPKSALAATPLESSSTPATAEATVSSEKRTVVVSAAPRVTQHTLANKYKDRAAERRATVGSEPPEFDRSHHSLPPASVHRPLDRTNKGHSMLKAMGWSEGSGLGREQKGTSEPVSVRIFDKRAGLGQTAASRPIEPTAVASSGGSAGAKQARWSKARQLYAQVEKEQHHAMEE
eukprot:m.188759 g.188759  ORF g.188759 m.188759 type:complete len:533 (-) comp18194_c1_seq3:33-1631(-)